ncbi:flagellar assembly protein A [Pseudoduganella violacea]|uniref:Flagellar Assembly Protein A N-terminal region domain-containing protein n=1 Tax=Pseudoduganella violacea TaxID=1715466 RepID=A0A7W5FW04_9BURK|nr:flagellar assembly protein A [Pseudoduganella violacea]MBB3121309.1 hypothetical protein [Pseudoduganella violacea]
MSDVAPAGQASGEGELPSAIVKREDGVYFQADAGTVACQAAANQVFLSSAYFNGLDYGVFLRALYEAGPELPEGIKGQPLIRFADDIVPFNPARRGFYKSVRISNGEAEYYFEPVFLDLPGQPPQQQALNFDEFVADMWIKGIRFGIDAPAVKAAIAHGKAVRLVAARRLNAAPGRDASIAEVSQSLHRSNAPRELANGRVDLHTFQNRFPQVKANVKLLRKVPKQAGARGYELSGIVIEPPEPRDLELTGVAGEGTVIEHVNGEDYLVSAVEGFVSVDGGSKRLSIGPKIVSREGVSVRTTGNLQLTGEYEEFGEVQEQRVVDGYSITIHQDVYGKINSRGGNISLQRNLIGGTAMNADGNIKVKGMASGAVLQTKKGEVVLGRAENCVISGSKVVVGEALNCEIMADEVMVHKAEGCTIAARKIDIDGAGPRKQAEMQLYVLLPDTSKYDRSIAEYKEKAARHAAAAAQRQSELDALTGRQDMRNYLTLATRVRKQEVVLTHEQLGLFQKMAEQLGPALKQVGQISLAVKEAQVRQKQMEDQAEAVLHQKLSVIGAARCTVRAVLGDTLLRPMIFNPDLGPAYDLAPKDIKARLRAASGSQPIFSGARGSIDWSASSAA